MNHPSCEPCTKTGGDCYDLNEDGTTDGCICSRASSQPYPRRTSALSVHLTSPLKQITPTFLAYLPYPFSATAFSSSSISTDSSEAVHYTASGSSSGKDHQGASLQRTPGSRRAGKIYDNVDEDNEEENLHRYRGQLPIDLLGLQTSGTTKKLYATCSETL
ncbi:unnamed protein product, partial [Protopolystoma xenopodis]